MRTALILALILAATSPAAFAANSQQDLMKTCNASATGKKGDERKAFMKSCLADGRKAQQEKMKTCSSQGKGKKGPEYKAYMKECLSK